MTKIKVCGMTNLEDAEYAASLGAWAIGLIHHADSPRFVEPEVAETIGAALKRRCEVAGVFVNSPIEDVVDAAEREQLTLIQFHGDEGPSFCAEAARRTGARVIRAFRVRTAADIAGAEAFRTDMHLFDAHRPGVPGGTGERFDWELLSKRRSEIPMILAGGVKPQNVGDAIALARPSAVDVVSGVEAEPGRKDHARVAEFIEAVRAASPDEAEAHSQAGAP
jgi:phosphoribosylanthranilate isomerase